MTARGVAFGYRPQDAYRVANDPSPFRIHHVATPRGSAPL
jgi:hypothetical protein